MDNIFVDIFFKETYLIMKQVSEGQIDKKVHICSSNGMASNHDKPLPEPVIIHFMCQTSMC